MHARAHASTLTPTQPAREECCSGRIDKCTCHSAEDKADDKMGTKTLEAECGLIGGLLFPVSSSSCYYSFSSFPFPFLPFPFLCLLLRPFS